MQRKAKIFMIMVILMLFFGLLMIGDVSLLEGERNYNDKFHFIKHQSIWIVLGLIAAAILSKIDYHYWSKISFFIYLFSIVALIAVLIPGVGTEIWGARRWINIGFLSFQPSELGKLSLLIYLSSLLSIKEKLSILNVFLILIPLIGLTLAEPDFGTAAIMVGLGLSLYFLSGVDLKKFLLPLAVFIFLGIFFILTSSYRRDRVEGLLDPFNDPLGSSYHAHQVVLTLGSGGVWGVGMGKSRQKYLYLPQVSTDSIMAVVAEEFGLVGVTIFLSLFGLLVAYAFKIAISARDSLGTLLASGIACWLTIQGLINLSSVAILLPLTGVPFPLISYGGSSLVSILVAIGIVLNIAAQGSKHQLRVVHG